MDLSNDPSRGIRVASIPFASAMVVLASIGFGSVPFFVRGLAEAGLAPEAIALARYALPALLFLPATWGARGQPRLLAWGVGSGMAMALGWIGYVRALDSLDVATVGVLYMTFPVFSLLACLVLFREAPTARAIVAALIVALAAGIAAGPAALAPGTLGAVATAMLAPLTFGLAIAVLVHRLPDLPVFARLGLASLGATLGLAPLAALTPVAELVPQDARTLALVVGIALAAALVPQLLYARFAPVVGAARAATAGALELPTMILIGSIALGETLSRGQWVGCALIVGAVALSPSRKVRRATMMAATLSAKPLGAGERPPGTEPGRQRPG